MTNATDKTKPNPDQLARSVPPLTRQWVEGVVTHGMAVADDNHNKTVARLRDKITTLEADMALLNARLASLEDRFNADTRIQLTRAKVAELYQKLTDHEPTE